MTTMLRALLALLFGTSARSAQASAQAPAPDSELITGVVDATGAAGVQHGPNAPWVLKFTLDGWRGADGIIHPARLRLHRTVAEGEVRAMRLRIHPYRLIRAWVRFAAPDSAELLELVDAPVPDDDPLWERARELAAPVTHEDPRFGTLTLDRSVGWYQGTAAWAGAAVRLNLAAANDAELADALQAAGRLWDDQEGWNERIQAYAVQELLEVKNESWLDEDKAELTPAEFRARMRLESITVWSDGGFDFWHDDGDLFWGHSIQVSGDLHEGPTSADIPG